MNRDQIYELHRLNKKISKDLANMVDYIINENFKEIDQLTECVESLIKIDKILRSIDYED